MRRGVLAAAVVLSVCAGGVAVAQEYQPAPPPVLTRVELSAPGPYGTGTTVVLGTDAAPTRADATLEYGSVILVGEKLQRVIVPWSAESGDFRLAVSDELPSGDFRLESLYLVDSHDGSLSCTTTSCRGSDNSTVDVDLGLEVRIDAGAHDLDAPRVIGATLLTAPVVGARDEVRIDVTADDASQIGSGTVTFRGPGGRAFTLFAYAPATGGPLRVEGSVPLGSPDGVYRISQLDVMDSRGNSAVCRDAVCRGSDGSSGPSPSEGITLEVTGTGYMDVTPPTLTALSASVPQQPLTTDQHIVIDADADDDRGVIGGGSLGLVGPKNRIVQLQWHQGAFHGTVPPTALVGDYVVGYVSLWDVAGNSLSCHRHTQPLCETGEGPVPAPDLDGIRLPLAGTTDGDAPVLRAVRPVPDATPAGSVITVGLDIVDAHPLGFGYGVLDGPASGIDETYLTLSREQTLQGRVRRSSQPGRYDLSYMAISDVVGNVLYCGGRSCYDETWQRVSDWDPPLAVQVTEPLPDTTAPVATRAQLLPTPQGSWFVSMQTDVSDEAGHLQDASLMVRHVASDRLMETNVNADGLAYFGLDWLGPGEHEVLLLRARDEADNTVRCTGAVCTGSDGVVTPFDAPRFSVPGRADYAAPQVTAVPDRAPGPGGWYTDDVTIDWEVTDAAPSSGVRSRPTAVRAGTEGRTVQYESGQACDVAGNCGTGTASVSIDRTPPGVRATGPSRALEVDEVAVVRCQVTDALSGPGGACSREIAAHLLPLGRSTVPVTGSDVAGNTAMDAAPVEVVLTYRGLEALHGRLARSFAAQTLLNASLKRVQLLLPGDFPRAVAAYQDEIRRQTGSGLELADADALLRLSQGLTPTTRP